MMSKRRTLEVLRAVLAVIVLAAVVYAVARNWTDVRGYLGRVGPGSVAAAAVAAAVSPVLTMLGWRVLLADLGSPLHVAPAAGVFFVGQLGKYLPGSVWSIVAQAEMGAALEVPRRRTTVAGLLAVGMAALTGVIVGVPALPALLTREGVDHVGWWLVLLVPLVLLALWPRVLNAVIDRGLRLLRREPLEHALSGRAVVLTATLFVAAWLAAGVHAWVLARAIGGDEIPSGPLLFASLCGFALASSLAMFSVVLPAGLGVREGLLVLLLTPLMPGPAAAAVVVLSRFLVTVVDVVFALAGWLYARSHHLLRERARATAGPA